MSIYRLRATALSIVHIDNKLSYFIAYLAASHLLIWRMRRNVLFIILVIGLSNANDEANEDKCKNTGHGSCQGSTLKDQKQNEGMFEYSGQIEITGFFLIFQNSVLLRDVYRKL